MSDLIRVEVGLLALPGPALNNGQKNSAGSADTSIGRERDGKSQGSKPFSTPAGVRMPVDPDKPTGPPPTFETNLLEARRARMASFGQIPDTAPSIAFPHPSVAIPVDFDPEKYAAVAKATAAPQTSESPKVDILR